MSNLIDPVAKALAVSGVLAAGSLAVAHAAPALSALNAVRPWLTPELCGYGDTDHVALTFDDGPDPASTPHFLAELDRAGVRATFFLLGRMLVRDPGLGRELVAAGHEIAVHGYQHRCLLARTPSAVRDDIARARDVIADLTGTQPAWYRPPYGVLTAGALATARELGLTPVLWSTWGRDWTATATPDSVHRTVTRRLAGGGTVLLHDTDCTAAPGSWRSALGALPRLVDTCRARGLRLGPLREHRATAVAPA
ncbi:MULTISPECIES: polysaccharide deacetylase family protein [Kitasatospora]|uniref:Polysaccharide deacetylase family protein n=1 Tax=Kitasatospora cystarginea TaxID=58350 RepID=A0ABN3DWY8_9ACTN